MELAGSIALARVVCIYSLRRRTWFILVLITILDHAWFLVVSHLRALVIPGEIDAPPAPSIPGCRHGPNAYLNLAAIPTFLIETTLFVATAYRLRTMTSSGIETPVMRDLMHSKMQYYLVVGPVLLAICFSPLFPRVGAAFGMSGIVWAVLCSMCTRLVLTTRKMFRDSGSADGSAFEMDDLSFKPPTTRMDAESMATARTQTPERTEPS
ncbi:hypothetical protein FRC08_009681 [Ceratobasidium sp. 394]|nr:hypothetical protein FRC08_009681 [Ceratobasidium sp. 394]KAG9089866.1 hypothetical protein FS749_000988 [Ceratobasidium sp. UAMH 11750]